MDSYSCFPRIIGRPMKRIEQNKRRVLGVLVGLFIFISYSIASTDDYRVKVAKIHNQQVSQVEKESLLPLMKTHDKQDEQNRKIWVAYYKGVYRWSKDTEVAR
jgi:hypothetical protein